MTMTFANVKAAHRVLMSLYWAGFIDQATCDAAIAAMLASYRAIGR